MQPDPLWNLGLGLGALGIVPAFVLWRLRAELADAVPWFVLFAVATACGLIVVEAGSGEWFLCLVFLAELVLIAMGWPAGGPAMLDVPDDDPVPEPR